MRCYNCLSKSEAKPRRPEGIEWVLLPLAIPVRCKRCLKVFYFPTVVWVVVRAIQKIFPPMGGVW